MSEQRSNRGTTTVRARRRRGAALVETALTLPLFLVFWFGIVDWGITYWVHETIVHNANLAARRAIVSAWDPVDPTPIRNLVVYGNTAGSGKPMFGLSAQGSGSTGVNVDVKFRCLTTLSPSLQEGSVCLATAWENSPRWVEIVVHDYSWRHFTPFYAGSYTGRQVTVSLPAEGLGAT